MKNHPDIEFLIQQTHYWGRRLKIKNLKVSLNDKLWGCAQANEWDYNNNPLIEYNPKYLIYSSKADRLHIMFHELGHIKDNNFSNRYPKEIGKMMAEWIAESRAWKWMKKYFPEYYRINEYHTKEDLQWTLTFPRNKSFYFLAFSQVPEFMEILEDL